MCTLLSTTNISLRWKEDVPNKRWKAEGDGCPWCQRNTVTLESLLATLVLYIYISTVGRPRLCGFYRQRWICGSIVRPLVVSNASGGLISTSIPQCLFGSSRECLSLQQHLLLALQISSEVVDHEDRKITIIRQLKPRVRIFTPGYACSTE